MEEPGAQFKDPGGRPRKEFSAEMWQEIDELCFMQCTGEEIAAFLNVDYDTLNLRCKETHGVGFSDYFKQKRKGGYASLRRKQWIMADTSAAMAIFLGKNLLDQRDRIEHSGDAAQPIQLRYNLDDPVKGK